MRNNNPLNIRHSADQWQGARKEQTDKCFVQFKSMAYGYRAAWKTMQTYYRRFCTQSKPYTVENIIRRWAPPDENPTEAYIRTVVRLSGIGERVCLLPPEDVNAYPYLSRLIAAMTCVECGMRMEQVDTEAISQGYRLAFPENKEELDQWLSQEDEFRDW